MPLSSLAGTWRTRRDPPFAERLTRSGQTLTSLLGAGFGMALGSSKPVSSTRNFSKAFIFFSLLYVAPLSWDEIGVFLVQLVSTTICYASRRASTAARGVSLAACLDAPLEPLLTSLAPKALNNNCL